MSDVVHKVGDVMLARLPGSDYVWAIVMRTYHYGLSCDITYVTRLGSIHVTRNVRSRVTSSWFDMHWTLIRCDDAS